MRYFVLLITWAMVVSPSVAQENGFIKDFRSTLQHACTYTQQVAEKMPADQWDYKPSEEMMSFRQQYAHLISNMYMLSSRFVNQESVTPSVPEISTYEIAVEELEKARKFVDGVVKDFTEEDLNTEIRFFTGENYSKRRILLLVRDHLTHHRAQMIVYLRMNGITPPRYIGW